MSELNERLLAAVSMVGPGDSLYADALDRILELEQRLGMAHKANDLWEQTHGSLRARTA